MHRYICYSYTQTSFTVKVYTHLVGVKWVFNFTFQHYSFYRAYIFNYQYKHIFAIAVAVTGIRICIGLDTFTTCIHKHNGMCRHPYFKYNMSFFVCVCNSDQNGLR